MRTITGNDTNFINNNKSIAQRHYPSTTTVKEEEKQTNTGATDKTFYTKIIDAFWESDILETLDEIVMLAVVIKNAVFRNTNVVQLSYSILSHYLRKKHHSTIDKTGQSLSDKGYIKKAFSLGKPNMYKVNFKKIEEDFNISLKDYYSNKAIIY